MGSQNPMQVPNLTPRPALLSDSPTTSHCLSVSQMKSITAHTVPSFPPLRACIFDMDGLLINTESLYFKGMNAFLASYNHPPLPQALKPRLMGVPTTVSANLVYEWAQLPISREQFEIEQTETRIAHYRGCEALPGAKELLKDLENAKASDGKKMRMALASSTSTAMFKLKSAKEDIAEMLGVFGENLKVLGDNPALNKGRGKPAPDIFLLALKAINETLEDGEKEIVPAECLVFEDSVPGVEAGRRAGMRVVWVPQDELVEFYQGKEELVLAGRTGLEDIGDVEQLGEVGDGWGEIMQSLEDFPYEKFGIQTLKD